MSIKPFRIVSADHTGITVSNLERSLAFWRDVLGFEFSHTAHQKGELAEEITGVKGAEIKLAVLKTPCGHKIELLEYLAPADRKRANLRSCDVGSVHVALLVEDLNAVLDRIAASGWKAAGNRRYSRKGRMPVGESSTCATLTAQPSSSCRLRRKVHTMDVAD